MNDTLFTCMAKCVFFSLLFIPTESVPRDILQDDNVHPEANPLFSTTEGPCFSFAVQNWLFFRKGFGLLSSQLLLQHCGFRSCWWPYPWYTDIFCQPPD